MMIIIPSGAIHALRAQNTNSPPFGYTACTPNRKKGLKLSAVSSFHSYIYNNMYIVYEYYIACTQHAQHQRCEIDIH